MNSLKFSKVSIEEVYNSQQSTFKTNVESAKVGNDPVNINSKIISIRDEVLNAIRNHMPIETLFTPELMIDLGLFIKDQMLFYRIAQFLAPLFELDQVTIDIIVKHFEGSETLAEIKGMFKEDPTHYLNLFYETCSDHLNKKPFSTNLRLAIEGRIFTLKNSLIAQHSPEKIKKSQSDLFKQEISSIKKEGVSFIRECLSLYLLPLKSTKNSSFKDQLTANAEQLIPFVQKITAMFLKENGKSCPGNPLTFRNFKGHNNHGLTAATVMESCLNVLGYATQILGRCDLEPKVTLSTAHNIVKVTAPDQKKYLVDPSYIQFLKDVYIEDSLLPTASVLILEENDVDKYIEKHVISHWIKNFNLVKNNVSEAIEKLKRQDQFISFVIDKIGLPKEIVPSNPEAWVRESFKRVWGLSQYSPILSNHGFHTIFNGESRINQTFEYIKRMNIASITHHRSYAEVEKDLKNLMTDPKLKGKNSIEALSLIAQLPDSKKETYAFFLDLDPRIQVETGFGLMLNAYFRSLRKLVNPGGKDKSVIYGCAGADCMSVLLATDAKNFTFVDTTNITFNQFQNSLDTLRKKDSKLSHKIKEDLSKSDNFFDQRSRVGGSSSVYSSKGSHLMNDLPLKLLFDLRETGVDLDKVLLTSTQNGLGIRIDFPWKYYGALEERMRSMTFVTADITNPDAYPDVLKSKLEDGFDIFYLKAAYFVPKLYHQFLPLIAKCIKKDGWLMTTDKTMIMEKVNPEECLQQKNVDFTLKKSEENRIIEGVMSPSFDPLGSFPQLELFDSNKRIQRTPGSDLTYWSILNLRQKN